MYGIYIYIHIIYMKHHVRVQNVREWCNSHREKIYKKLFRIIFKTAVVPFTHGLKCDMMLSNMYIRAAFLTPTFDKYEQNNL